MSDQNTNDLGLDSTLPGETTPPSEVNQPGITVPPVGSIEGTAPVPEGAGIKVPTKPKAKRASSKKASSTDEEFEDEPQSEPERDPELGDMTPAWIEWALQDAPDTYVPYYKARRERLSPALQELLDAAGKEVA